MRSKQVSERGSAQVGRSRTIIASLSLRYSQGGAPGRRHRDGFENGEAGWPFVYFESAVKEYVNDFYQRKTVQ